MPADPYAQIKAVEADFRVPRKQATIDVGSLNGATGAFSWGGEIKAAPALDGSGGSDSSTGPPLKPGQTLQHSVYVDAVDVSLKFLVKKPQGAFELTVNGVAVQVAQGVYSATVPISTATGATFTIASGARSFEGSLEIARPPLIGAGAFKIPVLPIFLVYDPPVDSQHENFASYTDAKSVGATFELFFSSEQTVGSEFLGASQFVTKIGQAASLVSSIAGQGDSSSGANAFSAGAQAIIDAVGQSSQSSEQVNENTTDNTLGIDIVETQSVATDAHLGPGQGDVFGYLTGVSVAWIADPAISLTILGYGDLVISSVKGIQDELQTNQWLSAEMKAALTAMLLFDPFVSDEDMDNNPRFVSPREDPNLLSLELHGPGVHYTLELAHTITSEDKTEQISTATLTEGENPGWFGLFTGLQDPSNQTVTTTSKQSASKSLRIGDEIKASVDLYAGDGESYGCDVYYDRVFGSFAFVEGITLGQPKIWGTAFDKTGAPLSQQPISVTVANQRFVTVTDASGSYSFSNAALPQGTAILAGGGATHTVTLTEVPTKVDLAPPSYRPAVARPLAGTTTVEPQTEAPTSVRPSRSGGQGSRTTRS